MGRRSNMANRYGRIAPIFNDDGAIIGYEDDPFYLMTRGWSRNFNERARGPSAFAKSSPALAESIARAKSAEYHADQREWLRIAMALKKTTKINSRLENAIRSEKGVDPKLDALIDINTKYASSIVKRERQAQELAESSGMSIGDARSVVSFERLFKAKELNERRGRERRKAEFDALREEYDESEERKSASRKARRKSDLQGYFAYKSDMFMSGLDDREQFAYAHAKQYGGGAKGRDRARDVWNRQFLNEFKWLKPLAKNSTFINKHLPSIAKGLGAAGKLPFGIGRLAANPYALVSAAAMGFFKANAASISQQRNIQPLLANTAVAGKAPLDFVEAGTKRGLTQEQIQQEYANIIGTFGSIEAVRQFAGVSPGIAKMAMAKSLGLSHSAFAIIDEMRGISTKFSGGASTDSLISDLNKYGMLPGTSISTKILSMLPEFMQKGIFAGYAATAGSEARAIGLGDPALRLAGLSDEEIIRRYGPEVSGLGFWHGTEVGIAGVPFAGEFARGFEDLTDSVLDFFGADATKETKAHRRRLANKIRKLWIEQHGNNHSSMLRGKTNLSDVYREATGAAESADSFDASLRESGTTVASITKGGDTISIDTVILRDVRNLDDFMNEVKRVAGGESIVASSDTLRMIDPGMI